MKYKKNIWFYVFLCLLFILFALCITVCRGSVYGWTHENEIHECGEDIRFFWEEMKEKENSEEEGRILYLYASSDLLATVEDGIMAVRLYFSLQDGWIIDSAQGLCEGEALNVTVGEGCILLDGLLETDTYVSDHEFVCLLRMEVTRSEGDNPFRIQWNPHERELLYVKGRDQQVSAYRFGCIESPHLSLETESDPPEPPSEETTAAKGEETDTQSEENTRAETDMIQTHPPEGEEETVTYLGCQETPVRDGTYAVRFLFYGSFCPLIHVRGGGILCASVTHPDRVDIWRDGERFFFVPEREKTLTVCTFRELSANQEYEFLITTGEGEYSIVYSYGLYRKK